VEQCVQAVRRSRLISRVDVQAALFHFHIAAPAAQGPPFVFYSGSAGNWTFLLHLRVLYLAS
jgi:hypothetical protein